MEVGLRGKARWKQKEKTEKEGERSKVRLLSHFFLLPLKSFGLRLLCYNISAACSSCEIGYRTNSSFALLCVFEWYLWISISITYSSHFSLLQVSSFPSSRPFSHASYPTKSVSHIHSNFHTHPSIIMHTKLTPVVIFLCSLTPHLTQTDPLSSSFFIPTDHHLHANIRPIFYQ